MREYHSGTWGFALIWGLRASVFPRALALAVPNALLAFLLSYFIEPSEVDYDLAKDAFTLLAGFTGVMSFVLGFRSNIAYRRWWEGGTLLQKTRGEWFNAYSSLIAFSSIDPAMEKQVEAYQHMLVRFMSLLLCSALQQVSPNKDEAFEIVKLDGIDPESVTFLRQTSDQVEVVLQWIQRSTILNAASGVLTAPPPILSRAFQEISRGIVNLQNARKIADFPFPFPYAQTSIVMLLIHWMICPVISCMMLKGPIAALMCFLLIFFLWCINYIAFDLENPFGTADNDLPMSQFQSDWNKSLVTLLVKRAQNPPKFLFDPQEHRKMSVAMSNGCVAKKRRMSMAEQIEQSRLESKSAHQAAGRTLDVPGLDTLDEISGQSPASPRYHSDGQSSQPGPSEDVAAVSGSEGSNKAVSSGEVGREGIEGCIPNAAHAHAAIIQVPLSDIQALVCQNGREDDRPPSESSVGLPPNTAATPHTPAQAGPPDTTRPRLSSHASAAARARLIAQEAQHSAAPAPSSMGNPFPSHTVLPTQSSGFYPSHALVQPPPAGGGNSPGGTAQSHGAFAASTVAGATEAASIGRARSGSAKPRPGSSVPSGGPLSKGVTSSTSRSFTL